MKSATKALQLTLALVLTTNTVYANGNIKINVSQQAQAQNENLRVAVREYNKTLVAYSESQLDQVQWAAFQKEVDRNKFVHAERSQDLIKTEKLIAKTSSNSSELTDLEEQRADLINDVEFYMEAIRKTSEYRNIFFKKTFPHLDAQSSDQRAVLASAVQKNKIQLQMSKMQVIDLVSAGNKEAYMKQLNEYEKSKAALAQTQVLAKKIDALTKNMTSSSDKKTSSISDAELRAFGVIAVLSMIAYFSNIKIFVRLGLAGIIAVTAYGLYKVLNDGSGNANQDANLQDKLIALQSELTKVNKDLEVATQDLELVIESIK